VNYVRTFVPEALSPNGFDYTVLADFERCFIIGARIPAGHRRGDRHVHSVDQIFFVVSGSLSLEVAGEEHAVRAGGVVFLPAGTPHSSWNETSEDEWHIDIMTPAPRRGQAFSRPIAHGVNGNVDSPGYVAGGPITRSREPLPGFSLFDLVDKSVGSLHAAVRLAEVQPGAEGPSWHVHDFDQFYFVLEGALTVEIAHEHHVARPMSLVSLPAGTPHRNWNADGDLERHLAILVPEPDPASTAVEDRLHGLDERPRMPVPVRHRQHR